MCHDCHVSHNECVMTAVCLIMIHAVSLTKHIVQYDGVCAILALQPVLFADILVLFFLHTNHLYPYLCKSFHEICDFFPIKNPSQ